MTIKKVANYIFEDYKNRFKLVIGEYATYNEYFIIEINEDNLIGIQTVTLDVLPFVCIKNKKILIVAGNFIKVLNNNYEIINQYDLYTPVLEVKLVDENIVIYDELDILCLNLDFNIKWKKEFNDVIEIKSIDNKKIVLKINNKEEIIEL